jgi:succinyl-CoA synthetase alpha subunit
MAILIDEHTRVVMQGITGRIGRFHTEEMIGYGAHVEAMTVAGSAVAPNPACIGETGAPVLAEHGLLGGAAEAGESAAIGAPSAARHLSR